MDALLVKVFAAALTFSQVATAPDALKTQFDPMTDRQQVVDLLRAGCAEVRKAFDIEAVSLDDLIATAMDDADAVTSKDAAFRGINIQDLLTAYRQFCKNEEVANSTVDLGEVIEFYNRTFADLPDHSRLGSMMLPGTSVVLDRKGGRLGEVFAQEQHRISVPLSDVPQDVQNAFVAAEDKRFHEHNGIDVRAMVRAFVENLAQSGRPQGGSTITQQVVKNLLVGEEVTYERKMQEMILASRVERILTKAQILELYLNTIFLGRGSWGIEMAARSYFGKSTRALTAGEGALLAALAKGPNYFSPDRRPERARERMRYVIGRMQADGAISAEDAKAASTLPKLVPYEGTLRLAGSYFTDHIAREIKTANDLSAFRVGSYTLHSTLDPHLQRAAESALQEGLARYEQEAGRVVFRGPETSLASEIKGLDAAAREPQLTKPSWQQALATARLPLPDVRWDVGVVVEKGAARKSDGPIRVGLADGRVLPLGGSAAILRGLNLYDVVLVRVTAERKGRAAQAELRVRPVVQGAVTVLENKTGRILAMAGGFSYGLSQLNRVTQSQRQPGSAIKPLTYLAALQKGLRPDTLVRDEEITLPPINGGKREKDYWSPKNYDGRSRGMIPMREALANSRNLATVNLLDGGIEAKPQQSLDRICALALELQIYRSCDRHYPFVLGAQPVRPIDLAAFYAAIASEGARPVPYAIESIEDDGKIVYRHKPSAVPTVSVGAASFYQLKTMLQGVVQHGTARAISHLAPYVAGKTGTTDDENDTWFMGFSNDVTVAIWVGYDNGDGGRRTLGTGKTGAAVALPMFEPIMEAVWAHHGSRAELTPPSPAAKRLLGAEPTEQARRDEKVRTPVTRKAEIPPTRARNPVPTRQAEQRDTKVQSIYGGNGQEQRSRWWLELH